MDSITQDLTFRKIVVKYSLKYGVTRASRQYKVPRRTIYRWREKYDGTIESLRNKSRRPHRHPNQHTEAELKLIRDNKARNKETGLVVLWIKLRSKGYTRSITSLYRVMCRMGIYKKTPRHNGKVERSHRKEQERLYYKRVFISFEDFKEKLRRWEREYNNFPIKPLGWKSPNDKLKEYNLSQIA